MRPYRAHYLGVRSFAAGVGVWISVIFLLCISRHRSTILVSLHDRSRVGVGSPDVGFSTVRGRLTAAAKGRTEMHYNELRFPVDGPGAHPV